MGRATAASRYRLARSYGPGPTTLVDALQEEFDVDRDGRVRSCIRPIVAAAVAAGHDVIRWSDPNQKHALVSRVALNGFSRSNGSPVSHQSRHHPCNPRRNAYI